MAPGSVVDRPSVATKGNDLDATILKSTKAIVACLAERFERPIPKAILVAFVSTFGMVNDSRFFDNLNG
ncbi:hypothetical protein N7379_23130 [Rhizobium pusense]|uniref:hypothetical protein n=1 Tax=Agrobacterium pusense TaxID=648995 RepID=UPI002447B795|nr:hypothetical protein [Agrobacterium pusense]MDH0117385.1 hypothetical protein [Agrobacterium pusense]